MAVITEVIFMFGIGSEIELEKVKKASMLNDRKMNSVINDKRISLKLIKYYFLFHIAG